MSRTLATSPASIHARSIVTDCREPPKPPISAPCSRKTECPKVGKNKVARARPPDPLEYKLNAPPLRVDRRRHPFPSSTQVPNKGTGKQKKTCFVRSLSLRAGMHTKSFTAEVRKPTKCSPSPLAHGKLNSQKRKTERPTRSRSRPPGMHTTSTNSEIKSYRYRPVTHPVRIN